MPNLSLKTCENTQKETPWGMESAEKRREDEIPAFWLTRALFLRGLGGIYFFAYLALLLQGRALFLVDGILPMELYEERLRKAGVSFYQSPSLFSFLPAEHYLLPLSLLGVCLSISVILGWGTALSLFYLWVVYLSALHRGQIFLGYGWETLLLEVGFFAMFLPPLLRPREFHPGCPPERLQFLLPMWILFRLMFGAGLIKLRGDDCWWELSCLEYHFETQPLPNPFSWIFHGLPKVVLHGGVLINHLVEVLLPWGLFLGRRARKFAGLGIILFQITLILSGNLSWLNYLTIVLCICCFDDHTLALIAPRKAKWKMLEAMERASVPLKRKSLRIYATAVALLSISPTVNLFSPHQAMNASFDPLRLVNTYGAFGSVGRSREEIILQGTSSEILDERTIWKDYEFPCKPGDVRRRPCIIAPYQLRLDWQIWFASFSSFESEPWLVRLVYLLLRGNSPVTELFASNPFPEEPPRFIRAQLYRYDLADPRSGAWWRREYQGPYFPAISLQTPALRRYLENLGLIPAPENSDAQ